MVHSETPRLWLTPSCAAGNLIRDCQRESVAVYCSSMTHNVQSMPDHLRKRANANWLHIFSVQGHTYVRSFVRSVSPGQRSRLFNGRFMHAAAAAAFAANSRIINHSCWNVTETILNLIAAAQSHAFVSNCLGCHGGRVIIFFCGHLLLILIEICIAMRRRWGHNDADAPWCGFNAKIPKHSNQFRKAFQAMLAISEVKNDLKRNSFLWWTQKKMLKDKIVVMIFGAVRQASSIPPYERGRGRRRDCHWPRW